MRHLFFITWYRQWFKNHEGIKGFAHQCMNWLMRSTLNLAAKLKKQNKQLTEKIKELSTELSTCILHPTIDADEYAALRGKIRTYSIILLICIIGEAFFNFFANHKKKNCRWLLIIQSIGSFQERRVTVNNTSKKQITSTSPHIKHFLLEKLCVIYLP